MIVHPSSGGAQSGPRAIPGLAFAAAAVGLAFLGQANAADYLEASANPAAHAYNPVHRPGKAAWVLYDVYDVPTGTTNLFFHDTCPKGGTAVSGAILANSTASNGFDYIGDGSRIDLNPPDYTTWFWRVDWASGSQSGSTLTTAVYCTK
ncbi:MAG TPA: hypothetical protein VHX61_18780 [Rhizomicrobium sp.]|nr:hypothetical protein [Rhizomicrobium sp.]